MSRRRLTADIVRVSAGIGVLGISSFALIAVAARVLPGEPFVVFSTWWMVTLLAGLCFTAFETYLPKAMGDELAAGESGRGAQVRLARRLLLGLGLLLAAGAALGPWAVTRLFDGDALLLALALAYPAVLALQSFQRGVAVARGRFGAVTVQMGADGSVRMLLLAACVVAGVESPRVLATSVLAASVLGLAAARLAGGAWWAWRGPAAPLPWVPLVALLAAAIGPTAFSNLPVPWLAANGDVSPYVIGGFAGAATLSRVPTLFLAAWYGPVVTPLVRSASQGDRAGFRRTYRFALLLTTVLGSGFVVLAAVLGPWAVGLFVGPDYLVSRVVTCLLGVGAGLLLVSAVAQAGAAALGGWTGTLIAAVGGLALFLCALLLPVPPVDAAALASALGAAAMVGALLMAVQGKVHSAERAGAATGRDYLP